MIDTENNKTYVFKFYMKDGEVVEENVWISDEKYSYYQRNLWKLKSLECFIFDSRKGSIYFNPEEIKYVKVKQIYEEL